MRVDLGGRVALVAGRSEGRARAIAALLEANGARVEFEEHGPVGAAEAAVSNLLARLGALDILVNVDASAPGAVAYCRAAATTMAARGGGRIVQIASVAGIVPIAGRADAASANAGVFAFTRAMALDLAPHGVLVNAIAICEPGDETHTISHTPLARVVTNAEVGNAALFLLAPESSYITGHVMTVDGGWSAGFARDF